MAVWDGFGWREPINKQSLEATEEIQIRRTLLPSAKLDDCISVTGEDGAEKTFRVAVVSPDNLLLRAVQTAGW